MAINLQAVCIHMQLFTISTENSEKRTVAGPKITHRHPHDTPQRNKHHRPFSCGPDKTFIEIQIGKG